MNVAIIGSGNVAWHLSRALEKTELRVVEICSRNYKNALYLSNYLYDVAIKESLDFSESQAQVFFICVSDDAIVEVCSKIILPENSIIVHTSGAKSLLTLTNAMQVYHDVKVNCGVFYPLMTFSKEKEIDFINIPICIEAENEETEAILVKIAQRISNDVYMLTSKERLVLHISAVFSCNFTNHLWALSKEILESEDLEFDMLKPLITETFKKAMAANHPADVQTGPAIRGDKETQAVHLKYLEEDEDLLRVYNTMSNSIADWHL